LYGAATPPIAKYNETIKERIFAEMMTHLGPFLFRERKHFDVLNNRNGKPRDSSLSSENKSASREQYVVPGRVGERRPQRPTECRKEQASFSNSVF
jgi:hypothetical protein